MESRALNKFESLFVNVALAANWVFLVTACVKGNINLEYIKKAFYAVQKRHYYLNVAVQAETGKKGLRAQFVYRPALPLPIEVREGGGHWTEAAAAELCVPFALDKGPLARVVLLKQGEDTFILTCFNHFIADAISGVLFVKEVLGAYGELCEGKTPAAAPAQETFHDYTLFPRVTAGFFRQLAFAVRYFGSRMIPAKHFPAVSYVPPEKRVLAIVPVTFTAGQTAALVKKTKAMQTTIQGVLCAAFALAFEKQIREEAGVACPVIETASVVNLRRLYRPPVPDGQLGMWSSQATLLFKTRTGQSFEDLARRFRREIVRQCTNNDVFLSLQVLRRLPLKTPQQVLAFWERTNPYIEVSNLGRMDLPQQYGNIVLDAIHFAGGVADSQAGKWGVTVDVVTFREQLHMNVLFLNQYWTEQAKKAVVDTALHFLI